MGKVAPGTGAPVAAAQQGASTEIINTIFQLKIANRV